LYDLVSENSHVIDVFYTKTETYKGMHPGLHKELVVRMLLFLQLNLAIFEIYPGFVSYDLV